MESTIIPTDDYSTCILSAERDGLNATDNGRRMVELTESLEALAAEVGGTVQACRGVYKGVAEASVAFTAPRSFDTAAKLRKLGARYSQESILFVTSEGHGFLAYLDADGYAVDGEVLGRYSPLHGAADAYTIVVATDERFTFI